MVHPVTAVRKQHRRKRAAAFYETFIPTRSLCFDIGANVGERTKALVQTGARVVAVEPHPDCQAALAKIPGITVVQAGVGDHEGQATLALTTASTIASMSLDWINAVQQSGRFSEYAWTKEVTVPLTTLDALIAAHGLPFFVKVDVEGYERHVLDGLSEPVPVLCFEFTPERIEEAVYCVARLESLGMTSFRVSMGETMMFSTEWGSPDRVVSDLRRLDLASFGDVYAKT